jgi:hypothetical protein
VTFLDDTWSDEEVAGWNAAAQKPDHERDQAFRDFYDHHSGSFVDSYVATDPFEDFAESFGIWCALGPGSPLIAQAVEGTPPTGTPRSTGSSTCRRTSRRAPRTAASGYAP